MQISSRRSRGKRMMADINVVPYIDVMLVLLVIFMITAPLVTPAIVDLPTVGHANPAQQTPPIVVSVLADRSLTLRYQNNDEQVIEQKMTIDHLSQFIAQRQLLLPNQPVVIAGDKQVPYEAVVQVMDTLKKQNIKRVGLLVKPN